MEFDVITFGSAVVDVFVHTDVYEKGNLMCYNVGSKILIKSLRFDIGGGGTNTAVAFSRLGLKTGCICKVGNDENGSRILDCLKKEKVRFLGKVDKKECSGYSVILDSRGGERTILTYKGANDNLGFNEININELKTNWLYYSALLEKSFDSQKKLAIKLSKKGVKLAFNPSLYIINNEPISELLKLTEVLILNHEEALELCKRYNKKEDLLISLRELGPKIIVITDKDNKVQCYDGNKKYSVMPHKNIKVIERTGAGDAFASGFVAGCIAGKTIPESLELGLRESESVLKFFGAKNKLLRIKIKNGK